MYVPLEVKSLLHKSLLTAELWDKHHIHTELQQEKANLWTKKEFPTWNPCNKTELERQNGYWAVFPSQLPAHSSHCCVLRRCLCVLYVYAHQKVPQGKGRPAPASLSDQWRICTFNNVWSCCGLSQVVQSRLQLPGDMIWCDSRPGNDPRIMLCLKCFVYHPVGHINVDSDLDLHRSAQGEAQAMHAGEAALH